LEVGKIPYVPKTFKDQIGGIRRGENIIIG
jgi:hypothetical protein